ncbi:MAG: protein kinase [Phycisphaerae bacterium]|jgi:serine/threonine protein kinase/WD40 repeat protein|nr:protein kinase [Phycisphaerae bacterium]
MAITLKEFAAELTGSGLMADDSVARCLSEFGMDVESGSALNFARELVASDRLTQFQADAVLAKSTLALVIGDYHVLDEIGQGGMGHVYRARHRFMDRIVAIKVMHTARAGNPKLVQRFAREVKAAAALTHPNIVTAYDAGETTGGLYLAMEYVDGPDISQLVKTKGALSVDQAVNITIQAARGLAYAHARNIVHRDIKPANLLLGCDGTVKVLDMGLARFTEEAEHSAEVSLTLAGRLMGTIEYMAPEHAANAKDADHRSDIYALGCVLYRLLTGKLPYGGSTPVEKLIAQREHPIPSLSESDKNIPQAIQDVFARMVAKEPADRFQSADEAIAGLIAAAPNAEKCELAGLAVVKIPTAASQPVGSAVETTPASMDAGDVLQVTAEDEPTPLGQSAGFPGVSISQGPGGGAEVPTDIIPIAKKAEPKKLLIVAVVLAVLAGVGVGLWFYLGMDDSTPGPAGPPSAPPPRVPVDNPGESKLWAPPGQWVDLLAKADPAQAIEGQWVKEPYGLVSPAKGNAKIVFPTELEGSYDLRLRFRRVTGNREIQIALPVSGIIAILDLGYRKSGPEQIRLAGLYSDKAVEIEAIQNSKEYLLDVVVRTRRGQVGVRVDCDGKNILDWSGPQWRLRQPKDWRELGIAPGCIAFSSWNSRCIVSDLQVRLPLGAPLTPWDAGENLSALAPRPAKIKGVRFWSLETRRLRGEQTAMAFSPDGRWLATGDEAGAIRILDASTGKFDRMFVGHRGTVFDLSFSKDSDLLVSAGKDAAAMIWEFPSGRRLHTLRGHEVSVMGAAFSPDGKTVATAGRNVGLWDARSGRFIRFLVGHGHGSGLLKWSPDGKMLASAGRRGDEPDLVWNVGSGDIVKRFDSRLEDSNRILSWSPDGKMLAVRGVVGEKAIARSTVAVFSTASWEMIRKIDCSDDHRIPGLLAWSPDGTRLLVRDKGGAVAILDTGTWKAAIAPGLIAKEGHNDAYIWSPDSKALSVRWHRLLDYSVGVGLIDSATGRTIWETRRTMPGISQGAAPPGMNGAVLVGARVGEDHHGVVWLWRNEPTWSSMELKPGRGVVQCAGYSPDGKSLAFMDIGGRRMLHVLDVSLGSGWKSHPMVGKGGDAISLSWSPDGKLLGDMDRESSLHVWDTETWRTVAKVPGQGGSPDGLMPAIWLSDSRRIISLLKEPAGAMGIWDARSGSLVGQFAPSKEWVQSCSGGSDDGKTIAVMRNDNRAEIWSTEPGSVIANVALKFIDGRPRCPVAPSSDGRTLAVADSSYSNRRMWRTTGYVHLWDTQSSKQRTLFGHPTRIRPLSFSTDGSMLATYCDRMLRIWDVAEGCPIRTYMPLPAAGCLAVSADGHYAVSKGVDAEKELMYVVVTDSGQETLTPSQFASKYGWENDPARVTAAPKAAPTAAVGTRPATTKPNGP